ncbi:secretin N-terminal domain-containing protein [Teredinibacter franksiae]|uniref:secretin N-terminal domain-containing protein n=1 Tax=Teredinibacter franksiae TaxID=2761453 RepID=UPI001625646B|nr:secretin N-terminal domain-containing protein [Teredinibacter franksiae]
MTFLLTGCTTGQSVNVQSSLAVSPAQPQFERDLENYRKEYESNPDDIAVLVKIRKMERDGERYYYRKARDAESKGSIESALNYVSKGLAFLPKSNVLNKEIARLSRLEELAELIGNAEHSISKKKYGEAKSTLLKAISLDQNNLNLRALLTRVDVSLVMQRRARYLVDLRFTDLDVRDAISFISKTYGINVVFDNSVKATEVSLDLKDVTYVDAIELLTSITKNAYKVLNSNTLIIFADTKDRQRIYADTDIQTFKLKTMPAKDMAALLKSVLGIKNVTVNESGNSIIIKDSPEVIRNASMLVASNDNTPGEVVFDVEIMEINQSKAERLGIDYGTYQISTSTPAVPVTGSILDSISEVTTLNIPSVSLNAFKQAVDARSLARPSIRVLDREKAKIHIGDRVPLRKSSIQDATGQTRTTFEYQEIGIRFKVESKIHSEDVVTVKVELEVSSLGENLGTATEQAFRIGTRNADTTMLVRDGETAILAGLLRSEGRGTNSGIAGTTNTPFFKGLFGSSDQEGARTDILLTLTPHIVRHDTTVEQGGELRTKSINSGNDYENEISPLDKLRLTKQTNSENHGVLTESSIKNQAKYDAVMVKGGSSNIASPEIEVNRNDSEGVKTEFYFASDRIATKVQDTTTVNLELSGLHDVGEVDLELNYNSKLVELTKENMLSELYVITHTEQADDGRRIMRLTRIGGEEMSAKQNILQLHFMGKRKGTSPLVAKAGDARSVGGEAINVQPSKTRIIIR